MSFNEKITMETSAATIMAASSMALAFEDILAGTPTTAAAESTILKYCSARIQWTIHDRTLDLSDLVFYVLGSRMRFVTSNIQVTHHVREGNNASSRNITFLTRRDGSYCETENFTFITHGEDGMWDNVVQMARLVRDSREQPGLRRRSSEGLPPLIPKTSFGAEEYIGL